MTTLKFGPQKSERAFQNAFAWFSFQAIIAITLILACCHGSDHTSISVSDTDDQYTFEASFPERKAGDVLHYINQQLKPEQLMGSVNDHFDVVTTLSDGTDWRIKFSGGNLVVSLDKSKSSHAGYAKIKLLVQGLKNIITKP